MSCKIDTTFAKVEQIGQTLLTSEIEANLKGFLDWAFLGVGAWFDVNIPTAGAWGGDFSTLRPVEDFSYTLGQVWETPRKDWVWETGTPYEGYNPINISGVYVNGALKGTGDSTYAHHYNYPLGRVVFDNPISTSDTVQLEYSYRNVQVYIADQAPWWDELQYNSMRVDDATFAEIGSGNWGILSNHRVQMPAIVVEAVPRRTFTPYELGAISQIITQDVIFHVVAESRWWRNQLVDAISLQQDKTLQLYDTDAIAEANVFPLDFRGMVGSTTSTYDALVNAEAYKFRTARRKNMNITEMESYNITLHEGSVRATLELIL